MAVHKWTRRPRGRPGWPLVYINRTIEPAKRGRVRFLAAGGVQPANRSPAQPRCPVSAHRPAPPPPTQPPLTFAGGDAAQRASHQSTFAGGDAAQRAGNRRRSRGDASRPTRCDSFTRVPDRTALVRRPSSRLGEGLVTHVERSAVDAERAAEQHAAYVAALAGAGWAVREVEPRRRAAGLGVRRGHGRRLRRPRGPHPAGRAGTRSRGRRHRGGPRRARARGRTDRGAGDARRRRRAAGRRHALRRPRRAHQRRGHPPAAAPRRHPRPPRRPRPPARRPAPQVRRHRAARRDDGGRRRDRSSTPRRCRPCGWSRRRAARTSCRSAAARC